MSQEMVNYHAILGELKGILDPIITTMRKQEPTGWRKQAWKGPIKGLGNAIRLAGPLGRIGWTSLPIIGSGLITFGSYLTDIPLWIDILTALFTIFLLYCIMVKSTVKNMITVGHPSFHIGAFKAKRNSEYLIWRSIYQQNYSFESLYHTYGLLLTPHSGNAIEAVLEYTKGKTEEIQAASESYRSDRDFLQDEVIKYEKTIGYLIELIKSINKSLYRYTNNCLDFAELDFVCGFTIYEIEGSMLNKIVDRGTSGISPDIIEITRDNQNKYASVDAAINPDSNSLYYNNPYPGRTVVSYRMKMLEGSWIWNFHFDDSNHKALSLCLSDDIIEVREIYRLVHAFCLILQKDMIEKKGATQNERSKNKTG